MFEQDIKNLSSSDALSHPMTSSKDASSLIPFRNPFLTGTFLFSHFSAKVLLAGGEYFFCLSAAVSIFFDLSRKHKSNEQIYLPPILFCFGAIAETSYKPQDLGPGLFKIELGQEVELIRACAKLKL